MYWHVAADLYHTTSSLAFQPAISQFPLSMPIPVLSALLPEAQGAQGLHQNTMRFSSALTSALLVLQQYSQLLKCNTCTSCPLNRALHWSDAASECFAMRDELLSKQWQWTH